METEAVPPEKGDGHPVLVSHGLEKECANCGKKFESPRRSSKFCSYDCSSKARVGVDGLSPNDESKDRSGEIASFRWLYEKEKAFSAKTMKEFQCMAVENEELMKKLAIKDDEVARLNAQAKQNQSWKAEAGNLRLELNDANARIAGLVREESELESKKGYKNNSCGECGGTIALNGVNELVCFQDKLHDIYKGKATALLFNCKVCGGRIAFCDGMLICSKCGTITETEKMRTIANQKV